MPHNPEANSNTSHKLVTAVMETGLFPEESDMLESLRGEYPNKVFYPFIESSKEAAYLKHVGLRAMVAVLISDSTPDGYIHYGFQHQTPYMQALTHIHDNFPPGSTERGDAFRDLVTGAFAENWSEYFPRQED